VRLLLDEHYSAAIAVQLREAGHDVTSVQGDAALEGCDDAVLMQAALAQGRALLTNNVRHFAPLAREWAARGEQYFGLIFTSDESMPRSRRTIGLYVERLDELLERHPSQDALRGRTVWL
jgi:hypothetical protein